MRLAHIRPSDNGDLQPELCRYLTPGTYTASETNNSGYTASVWGGDCAANGSITLANGDNKTCTITNDDTAPLLTLIKTVTNDNGGSASETAWTLNATGAGGSPTNLSSTTPVFSGATFKADTYALSETGGPSGYTASQFSCVKNGAAAVLGNSITLAIGDIAICTINNNDNTPPPAPSGGGGGGSYSPPVPPLINILKIPNPLALPGGPGSVTYTYTVTNIGTVAMNNVTVADNKCASVNFISGDTNGDSNLQTNETWIYRCTVSVNQTTTNIVTATGHGSGLTAIDTAEAIVVVGAPLVPPLIHIVKVPDPLTLPAGGGNVVYRYAVTNPGIVALSDVGVTDDKCTGLPARVADHPGDLNKNNLLDPNEKWSFTCSSKLTKTTINTATAKGSANGFTVADIAYATVVVAAPKLPNTGIGPDDKNIPWNIIVSTGIIASLFLLYATRRKQTV